MRDGLLQHLLNMEAPLEPFICVTCKHAPIQYKCLDCHGLPQVCQDCLLSLHSHNLLHKVEEWTGTYFKKASLKQAGLVVHLGHGGGKCPSLHSRMMDRPGAASSQSPSNQDSNPTHSNLRSCTTTLNVVDIHGIFSMDTLYCECDKSGAAWQQLFLMGYFPASTANPSTVFTFKLLDYVALDLVENNTSAMAFMTKVYRCTDNVFPQDVKVGLHIAITCKY